MEGVMKEISVTCKSVGEKFMKKMWVKSLAFAFVVFVYTLSYALAWEYPAIKGYGPAYPLPNAALQPDKSIKYKVLFDITGAAKSVDKVNPGLDHVARFINLMAFGGMMSREMELAVVVHGPATPIVLRNEIFKARFKKANPNEEIIKDLNAAGVKLYVCGQALAEKRFKEEWVNEQISVALSALVVVPTFQLKGYAYLPLF